MEDITLVIKVPKEEWEFLKETDGCRWSRAILEGIINGTPIDKYDPCATMSKAFANSLTYVKILKDENEELKNKINKILAIIEANKEKN